MAVFIKPGWSRPSTILFAAEIPINEKAFSFALAQAAEHSAKIIILHVFDIGVPDLPAASGSRHSYTVQARIEKHLLESPAERASRIGIRCRVMVRQGKPAEQILSVLRERKIDRVVMGAHSPGPVGKMLVGSVAETVLRRANVPVCIVGPHAVEGTWRNRGPRRILCDVSKPEVCHVVANIAAELAIREKACLFLQRVIPPQQQDALLAGNSLGDIVAELPHLVQHRLPASIPVQARAVVGDPIEELLYQGRAHQANLIVLGAPGASSFAAVSRADTVYKVLAYSQCPVMALSPVLLEECGIMHQTHSPLEVNYMAGII